MEFIANFMNCDQDPVAWSRSRESEGWQVLGCADHLWSGTRPFPHVWVTLATMAAATTRPLLTTSFANNLLRSPVEFAQAALQMQAVSGGRFEAGLGAGWSRDEAVGAGIGYPPPGIRAGRFIEAIQIVRALLIDGSCTFEGAHYRIDVPVLGPRSTASPPPLVASLGGDRTIRSIAPIVDRVELKLISSATRDGALDMRVFPTIPRSHLTDLVDKVRAVNPTVPMGAFILCAAGTDGLAMSMSDMLGDCFLGQFFGEPAKVADALHGLADVGLDRVQVSPLDEASFALLAPHLF